MSIYSGFAVREQETHYNTTLYYLTKHMQLALKIFISKYLKLYIIDVIITYCYSKFRFQGSSIYNKSAVKHKKVN